MGENMAFRLARGARNIVTEVQRWQYFLRKRGIAQVGAIDGDFGLKSETGTKMFQASVGISPNGKVDDRTLTAAAALGYSVKPDDYYDQLKASGGPPAPGNLTSPGNASRNRDFTCFKFRQLRRDLRPDKEAIVIRGSCDGTIADWVADKIVDIEMPQLRFARGYNGAFRTHRLAAPQFKRLFERWERDDLLHLILTYEGCFVPRYKRNQAPAGDAGHGDRESKDVPQLSNHSFGSAFDINYADNLLGSVPADWGAHGCTRELVAAANAEKIYWGGHFGTQDGMHFEISKLT
jgi:hypothetical protein